MNEPATAPEASVREPVLVAQELRAAYGRIPVLHGLDLAVYEDEIVGILGHNGMGKSTLLKALMGLVPATGGAIVIDGADLTKSAAHTRSRRGIGYVPQGRGIIAQLTAEENLRLAYRHRAEESEEEAVARVLKQFPRLQPLLSRRGGLLSGGEQQLLALARALVPDPWMLLLDEPTEGIQPSIILEMAETLRRLRREHGLTILVVEQNLEFILDTAERVLILERGRIVGELSGTEMKDPARLAELSGLGGARTTRSSIGVSQARATEGTALQQPSAAQVVPGRATTSETLVVPSSRQPPERTANPEPTAVDTERYMTVRRPTLEQMRELTGELYMKMSDEEIRDYMNIMEGTFKAYDRVDSLPDYLPKVKYPRTPGARPAPGENPLNAWYVKCEVRGAGSGPLEGKRVVLKDNICLAGVPMMNGASTLEGYVPDVDATLVQRILDAGGTIMGKAHCEYFCLSGGSHTCAAGPVHNPYRLGYSAGGSSSGCGALVGAGEMEMAIGGDQGGSVRMPASFCGCYGMKPTHGLVPYTGIMPIESTIDHTGPITASVRDNALLLEVIAGADGLDPRQYAPRTDRYTEALVRGSSGLRIGIVKEGFGHPNSEADVDAKVRGAAERLSKLGAQVEEVSIPMHLDGVAIWTPIALEGLQAQMMNGNGFGFNWEGLYITSLLDRHASWRSRADELSPSLKISMFIGEYFIRHYGGRFYAKAQNLSRLLRKTYDDVFKQYDLLLMPTTPMKAPPLPPADAPLSLYIQRAFEMIGNTAPFDASGHPAMSIPCALSEGLPVGMMLIGRRYEESTIYRAAYAFEQSGDWREM